MYQVLGIKQALSWFTLLCVGIFVAYLAHAPLEPNAAWPEWWKRGTAAVSTAGLIVFVAGQTPLFPLLCRLPWVRKLFPPIDGIWTASLESNWGVVGARAGDPVGGVLKPVYAKVTIVARLFFVRINLVTDDNYSTSKTQFVHAARDPEDGGITLHYVYRNATRSPASTDSDSHDGAGRLTVIDGQAGLRLEGVYWTNRNWKKGLNTAGVITLQRSS